MRKDLLAYLALGAICIIWGTTYLALRIAVLHFPPFLFTALRQITAGALLVGAVMIFAKVAWPDRRHLIRQAIAGFFIISMGNGLVAWAEMYVSSGIAAVVCSLLPVIVILMNLGINREEKPTLPIYIGTALGFVGIMMVFGEHLGEFRNSGYIAGIILIFIAELCWGGGGIWIKKKNAESNPFLNAGLQMFFGGVWMLPVSMVFDDFSSVSWSAEGVYAMLYLVIFGSIVAFTCYTYALKKLPVTIVSLYAYVNPLVAVVLGWLILDEKLNARIIVAIMITLAGIYIVNRGYQLRNLWRTQFSK